MSYRDRAADFRKINKRICRLGAIQVLRNADGVGRGVKFSGKKRNECVRFNVISVTRGWVGVQFPGKKRYVTLEWPPRPYAYLEWEGRVRSCILLYLWCGRRWETRRIDPP